MVSLKCYSLTSSSSTCCVFFTVMPSPQFFDGQALVSWSEPDVTVAVPWYIGLMFRTRKPAGTLMQVNAGPSSTINLMVSNRTHHNKFIKPAISVSTFGTRVRGLLLSSHPQVSEQQVRMEVLLRQQLLASLSFPQVRVNDGEWHHLLVELKSVKDGKDFKYMAAVSLDYDMFEVQTRRPPKIPFYHFTRSTVQPQHFAQSQHTVGVSQIVFAS